MRAIHASLAVADGFEHVLPLQEASGIVERMAVTWAATGAGVDALCLVMLASSDRNTNAISTGTDGVDATTMAVVNFRTSAAGAAEGRTECELGVRIDKPILIYSAVAGVCIEVVLLVH